MYSWHEYVWLVELETVMLDEVAEEPVAKLIVYVVDGVHETPLGSKPAVFVQ